MQVRRRQRMPRHGFACVKSVHLQPLQNMLHMLKEQGKV